MIEKMRNTLDQSLRFISKIPKTPKRIVASFLPHGFVNYVQTAARRRAAANSRKALNDQVNYTPQVSGVDNVYDNCVEFLSNLGCEEFHVRDGSMPKSSLLYCERVINKNLPDKPLKVLHVGNFVGVSLACITSIVLKQDLRSLVLSIDPNIRHRNIENPMDKTVRLLSHLNFQKNSLILTGFSLAKNLANDGFVFDGYDPSEMFLREYSLENQLDNLSALMPAVFDLAIIDGNHDPQYLEQEISVLDKLVRRGGILILDDVDEAWAGVQDLFQKLSIDRYTKIGTDGRIGILRKN